MANSACIKLPQLCPKLYHLVTANQEQGLVTCIQQQVDCLHEVRHTQ